MAVDAFPIYEILVEQIFGSYIAAIIGIAIVIFVFLMLGRAGLTLTIMWLGFYFMVMLTFYFGGIALLLSSVLIILYIIFSLLNKTN